MVSECAGPASAVFWQGVRLDAHADQKRHVRGRLRSSPDWHPTIAWPSLSLDTGSGPSTRTSPSDQEQPDELPRVGHKIITLDDGTRRQVARSDDALFEDSLHWWPPRRRAALVHGSRAVGEPRSTSWPSWRQQVHDLDMKSSVHPKYKTKYHVGNWPAYDRALVQRGDITVWLAPDAIATWEAVGVGTRGG